MAVTLGAIVVAFASVTLDEDGGLGMTDTMGTVALLAANL